MLKKEMWSRQCDCVGKFVPHLGAFFAYAAALVMLSVIDGSEIEPLIEFLPVISSEFGLNVFCIALGIFYCSVMYGGAYVIEIRCDASGHGDSTQWR